MSGIQGADKTSVRQVSHVIRRGDVILMRDRERERERIAYFPCFSQDQWNIWEFNAIFTKVKMECAL